MNRWILIVCGLLIVTQGNGGQLSEKLYLEHRISPENQRYPTFYRTLELLNERNAKILLETSSSRSRRGAYEKDGGSTIIFSHWALTNNAEFFSIESNPKHLSRAKSNVHMEFKFIDPCLHFICSDLVPFLNDFDRNIDFLYLDSYDFDEKNPFPSQYQHLSAVSAAYPFLTEESIVLIDGCSLPHGGKGKLAAQFLMERGWKILENSYQVLLIYPK